MRNQRFKKRLFWILDFGIDAPFGFWNPNLINFSSKKNSGITLLLIIVLLSAILSIGIGVFSVIYGQTLISGEVSASLRALYATDQGIEKLLYMDRSMSQSLCPAPVPSRNCFTIVTPIPAASGGCYTANVSKEDIDTPPDYILDTVIQVVGEYPFPCTDDLARAAKRSFEITYPSP